MEDLDELTPEFIDKREQSLFGLAQLGVQAQQFMESEIGRHVVDKMQKEIDECALKLLVTKDMESISELQTKALTARQAVEWLMEAIAEGDIAYQQLQEGSQSH